MLAAHECAFFVTQSLMWQLRRMFVWIQSKQLKSLLHCKSKNVSSPGVELCLARMQLHDNGYWCVLISGLTAVKMISTNMKMHNDANNTALSPCVMTVIIKQPKTHPVGPMRASMKVFTPGPTFWPLSLSCALIVGLSVCLSITELGFTTAMLSLTAVAGHPVASSTAAT